MVEDRQNEATEDDPVLLAIRDSYLAITTGAHCKLKGKELHISHPSVAERSSWDFFDRGMFRALRIK